MKLSFGFGVLVLVLESAQLVFSKNLDDFSDLRNLDDIDDTNTKRILQQKDGNSVPDDISQQPNKNIQTEDDVIDTLRISKAVNEFTDDDTRFQDDVQVNRATKRFPDRKKASILREKFIKSQELWTKKEKKDFADIEESQTNVPKKLVTKKINNLLIRSKEMLKDKKAKRMQLLRGTSHDYVHMKAEPKSVHWKSNISTVVPTSVFSNATISKVVPISTTSTPTFSKEVTTSTTSTPTFSKEVTTSTTSTPTFSKEVTTSTTSTPTFSKEVPTSATSKPAVSKEVTTSLNSKPAVSKEIPTSATSKPAVSKEVTTSTTSKPTVSTEVPTSTTSKPAVSKEVTTSTTSKPTVSRKVQTAVHATWKPTVSKAVPTYGYRKPTVSKVVPTAGYPKPTMPIHPNLSCVTKGRGFYKAIKDLGTLNIPGIRLVRASNTTREYLKNHRELVKLKKIHHRYHKNPSSKIPNEHYLKKKASDNGKNADNDDDEDVDNDEKSRLFQKRSYHMLCQETLTVKLVMADYTLNLAYEIDSRECDGTVCSSSTFYNLAGTSLGQCTLVQTSMLIYVTDQYNTLVPKTVTVGAACKCMSPWP